jgi:hypothetical protein
MDLAKHSTMKESISLRNLLLLAGILVAVIAAFLLLSGTITFTTYISSPQIPNLDAVKTGKVFIDKVISVIYSSR